MITHSTAFEPALTAAFAASLAFLGSQETAAVGPRVDADTLRARLQQPLNDEPVDAGVGPA